MGLCDQTLEKEFVLLYQRQASLASETGSCRQVASDGMLALQPDNRSLAHVSCLICRRAYLNPAGSSFCYLRQLLIDCENLRVDIGRIETKRIELEIGFERHLGDTSLIPEV